MGWKGQGVHVGLNNVHATASWSIGEPNSHSTLQKKRQPHLDVIGKVEVAPKAKASAKAGVEVGSFLTH